MCLLSAKGSSRATMKLQLQLQLGIFPTSALAAGCKSLLPSKRGVWKVANSRSDSLAKTTKPKLLDFVKQRDPQTCQSFTRRCEARSRFFAHHAETHTQEATVGAHQGLLESRRLSPLAVRGDRDKGLGLQKACCSYCLRPTHSVLDRKSKCRRYK